MPVVIMCVDCREPVPVEDIVERGLCYNCLHWDCDPSECSECYQAMLSLCEDMGEPQ